MRLNTNFIIHEEGLDVSEIQTKVANVTQEEWDKDLLIRGLNPQPLGETRNLVLGWVANVDDPKTGFFTDKWQEWKTLIEPIIQKIVAIYGEGGVSRCVLAKLPAGAKVSGHYDVGGALQKAHRFHLPIITNPGMDFIVNGERVPFEVGTLIEINNQKFHSVDNTGSEDRVHLIVDYWVTSDACFSDPSYMFIPKDIPMGVDLGI